MAALRVYCSGPLFCPEEVGGMTAIAQRLEAAGMNTFLPHRDGLEPYVFGLLDAPDIPSLRAWIDHAVFALDVYQLVEACDVLVCLRLH